MKVADDGDRMDFMKAVNINLTGVGTREERRPRSGPSGSGGLALGPELLTITLN